MTGTATASAAVVRLRQSRSFEYGVAALTSRRDSVASKAATTASTGTSGASAMNKTPEPSGEELPRPLITATASAAPTAVIHGPRRASAEPSRTSSRSGTPRARSHRTERGSVGVVTVACTELQIVSVVDGATCARAPARQSGQPTTWVSTDASAAGSSRPRA